MPIFDVEISGKPYEVDAPDQQSAVAGAQRYHNDSQVSGPSLASAAVEGMPIIGGLAPKIGAAVQAATEPLLGRGSTAGTYDQRYEENLARHQARSAAFGAEHPIFRRELELSIGRATGVARPASEFTLRGHLPQPADRRSQRLNLEPNPGHRIRALVLESLPR